jgi:Fe-S-cluster-containing dehydrogenase component
MASMKRYGFVIDVARCTDCRACVVPCSVENNVPINHTHIWVKDLGMQGEFPNLQRGFVPYNCMHCDNPPCIDVCVSGATFKDADTGLVLVDQEACIGCGYCVEACPCDARMFGDLNDPQSEVSLALKNATSIQRLDYEKKGYDTDPNIYYIYADVLESSLLPRDPRYTLAEEGWKRVLVPAIFAGIGASFLLLPTGMAIVS